MSRHTPGPWIPLKGIFWSVENEDGYRIASLVESENIGLPSNDDSQANANLIAAAPVLLGTLVMIKDTLPHIGLQPATLIEMLRRIDSAIARAKGEL